MTTHAAAAARPIEIKRQGKQSVEIRWDDGHLSTYPNRHLRDGCPCATCREAGVQRSALPVVGGVEIYPLQIGIVGRYAISIQWSDQHATGIYSYETLRALCPCECCQSSAILHV